MIVPLAEATASHCGGKAAALATLMRAGFAVPDGFVLPFSCVGSPSLRAALAKGLASLGDFPVAVRSSASNEDTVTDSAAGRYATFLGVQGVDAVAEAVKQCWTSLPPGEARMAVLIQRHVDADVSGVMFTSADGVRIEASWGLGLSVVGGTVTPDTYHVSAGETVARSLSPKRTRIDRVGAGLITRHLSAPERDRAALDDADARRLASMGLAVGELFGRPQDIEWAISGDRIWVLQSRAVTADLPAPIRPSTSDRGLSGAPGSPGVVTGIARVVHGPAEFSRVQPGDVLVCRYTDPGWMPLLRIVGGVITETGGVLSHAAIVAREHRIPAVLAVPGATSAIRDGSIVTINGAVGTVTAEEV